MLTIDNDIRSLRQSAKMPLKTLAARAGVSISDLSKCERGLFLPDERFFVAVSGALGAESADLRAAHHNLAKDAVPGEGYVTSLTKEGFVIPRRRQPNVTSKKMIDLFCGTGAFSHGFEQTGQFQVTAGIDLLADRTRTFAENHPTATAICGDINGIMADTLGEAAGDVDVIIGGPPCQGFSSIRPFRALTENDPRNNLFERYVIIVGHIQPKWFVMENVVGLLTHKNGDTLSRIVSLFSEVGYSVEWRILNTALYGLPQRRERLIMIGNRVGAKFEWPVPTHFHDGRSMAGKLHQQRSSHRSLFDSDCQPAVTVMDAIHDLPEIKSGESATAYKLGIRLTQYERSMRDNETRLTMHEATAHSENMLRIIRQAGHNRAALPEGLTTSGFSSSYSRLEPDLPSVTLTVNFVHPSSNKCIHPFQDRALTPREGARLQGFEDSYTFVGKRAQVVKQIGNAVPPILGHVIGQALAQHV